MADKSTTPTEYKVSFSTVEEIPAPPELVSGVDWDADTIMISAQGTHLMGTLLAKSEGYFVPATADNIASADEICILADMKIEVPENSYAYATGYFSGVFRGNALILWEGADISAVKPILRKHKIFLD